MKNNKRNTKELMDEVEKIARENSVMEIDNNEDTIYDIGCKIDDLEAEISNLGDKLQLQSKYLKEILFVLAMLVIIIIFGF